MTVVDVAAQPPVTEVFIESDGVHLLTVAGSGSVVFRIQILAHAHEVLLRKAVAGEGHLAVVLVKTLRVTQAIRATTEPTLFLRQPRPRLCGIKRQRP